MLTKMTEETWTLAVDIFRQVGPWRGQKGADDRRFLEALHYFTVHNITWRALPETFGNWNAIWKRFSRLSRNGTFEAFFRALAGCSRTAAVIQMFDSTTARAHVSAAGAKNGGHQALGRSRGGFGTKIHIKCDLDGLPLDFHLTGAEASDSPQFEILFNDELDATPRAAIADKGYDAKYNRDAAWEKGCVPVIPRRSNSKAKGRFFPRKIYKLRAQIEQFIGKAKRFKRFAMRCEKTASNYAAIVALVFMFILVQSVHTAVSCPIDLVPLAPKQCKRGKTPGTQVQQSYIPHNQMADFRHRCVGDSRIDP